MAAFVVAFCHSNCPLPHVLEEEAALYRGPCKWSSLLPMAVFRGQKKPSPLPPSSLYLPPGPSLFLLSSFSSFSFSLSSSSSFSFPLSFLCFFFFFFFFINYLFVCGIGGRGTCPCGSQRMALWSRFSPAHHVGSGDGVQKVGLGGGCLCLPAPALPFPSLSPFSSFLIVVVVVLLLWSYPGFSRRLQLRRHQDGADCCVVCCLLP